MVRIYDPFEYSCTLRVHNNGLAEVDISAISFFMLWKPYAFKPGEISGPELPARIRSNGSEEWRLALTARLFEAHIDMLEDYKKDPQAATRARRTKIVMHYTSFLYPFGPKFKSRLPPTIAVTLGNRKERVQTCWRAIHFVANDDFKKAYHEWFSSGKRPRMKVTATSTQVAREKNYSTRRGVRGVRPRKVNK